MGREWLQARPNEMSHSIIKDDGKHLLGLARSTARRLVLMYQKEIGCQSKATKNLAVPNTVDIGTRKGHSQHPDSNIDKEVLEQMPKTFQTFSSLLSRVRDMEGEIE